MSEKTIQTRYKINPGTLDRINKFKAFVGEKVFENILQGLAMVEIPFEEEKYVELLMICLQENLDEIDIKDIPYQDAEEIISFFCKPFAGRSLKQAKYTMDGISSMLHGLDPNLLKTAMESISSRMKNEHSSDASNLQKETSGKEKESIN